MRLYSGAAAAAGALLILTSGYEWPQEPIVPVYVPTEQDIINLSKVLGCAASCAYAPLNWFQLLLCAVTSQKGSNLKHLCECSSFKTDTECKVGTSTDGNPCFWFARSEPLTDYVQGGACLPAYLRKVMFQFNMVASRFFPAPDGPRVQPQGVPEYQDLMYCLCHSLGEGSDCTNAPARSQITCGLTDAIDPTLYPTVPQLTKLCVQTTRIKRANELLNSAPGPPVEKCPKPLTLCKDCGAKECSRVPTVCARDCPTRCSTDCPVECSRDCPKTCSRDCPKNCLRDCPTDCSKDCPTGCSKDCPTG